MTLSDPVRWLDDSDGALSDDERETLRAHVLLAPDAGHAARMWQRLEHAATAAPPAMPLRNLWRWGAGGLVVAIGAVWWALSTNAPPPAAPHVAARPARMAASVGAPDEPVTAAEPTPSTAAPAPRPSRKVRPMSRHPSTAAVETPSSPRLGAELALLTPARQLLATDPARSLALADEHARSFPRGAFAEERSFLRIAALWKLGNVALARREADGFRQAYPHSPYWTRLTELLRAER